jgi:hypothetical protein
MKREDIKNIVLEAVKNFNNTVEDNYKLGLEDDTDISFDELNFGIICIMIEHLLNTKYQIDILIDDMLPEVQRFDTIYKMTEYVIDLIIKEGVKIE